MSDLEYTNDGVIIRFYPNTDHGIEAYNTMTNAQDGCANIFAFHKDAVFKQLKKAGITIAKAKPSKQSIDDILKELEL